MVRRWDLTMVKKEMLCASLCVGSMRNQVSMRDCTSRGCPWWLYICSQLGFTSSLCLLLQVEVLGLAGFMYPSSGLLSWSIAGMLKVRARGVVPLSKSLWKLMIFPKMRVFWWRLIWGILSYVSTLKHYHVRELGRCDTSLAVDETLMHALITCSYPKRFWKKRGSCWI
jgi:hypothetical protein